MGGADFSCTVVFDFDGTLAPGRGPVIAYADAVATAIDQPDFRDAASAAIDDYEDGRTDVLDGYSAVAAVAQQWSVPSDVLQAAYLHSRSVLASPDAPIAVPDGLRDFLVSIRPPARLVLATNAPATRVDAALDVLGIADLIDEHHHSLGKPAGLTALLERLAPNGPVLSVGDIWRNDLAPAAALGFDTAIVGHRATAHADDATMAATELGDLYGPISAWVHDVASDT